jgi:hypothetical protein
MICGWVNVWMSGCVDGLMSKKFNNYGLINTLTHLFIYTNGRVVQLARTHGSHP